MAIICPLKFWIFKNIFYKINSLTAFDQNSPAPEEESTKGYTIIDSGVGGNIKIKKQEISISIFVNNIFDKKYVDHLSTLKEVGYFNPGRNLAFTLKVPFGLK